MQTLRDAAKEKVTSALIETILDAAGYRTYLLDGTAEGEDRLQNVQELFSVAKKYDECTPEESLRVFLQEVALVTDLDALREEGTGVTLMTLHGAKGLEFDHVIIAGMEESLFPHSQSFNDPNGIEEERRLCYVGITRARETVTLITAKQRTIYGNIQVNGPSRFLSDIDARLVETESNFSEFSDPGTSGMITISKEKTRVRTMIASPNAKFQDGDKVKHPTFGVGVVVGVSGDIVSIAFVGKGIKRFAAHIAPIEKV